MKGPTFSILHNTDPMYGPRFLFLFAVNSLESSVEDFGRRNTYSVLEAWAIIICLSVFATALNSNGSIPVSRQRNRGAEGKRWNISIW